MNKEVLVRLGLTKNEVKIYLALLNLGPSRAGKITEQTSIHRRNVYDCIERLIEKGLVSYIIENKKKFYRAASPQLLLRILKDKEDKLREDEANLNLVLPELMSMRRFGDYKHDANIFRGKEGLKAILEDILHTERENMIIGAESKAPKILKHYLKHFHGTRTKKKIVEKLIFNSNEKERKDKLNKLPFTEARLMPKGHNPPVTVNIYGDKTALITWSEEEPFGVLIENAVIARGFRDYFKILWEISSK
ncbi:MAG: hypothetical protein GY861_09975 [bacterium]|nr:hypothetical protein [bacterium]